MKDERAHDRDGDEAYEHELEHNPGQRIADARADQCADGDKRRQPPDQRQQQITRPVAQGGGQDRGDNLGCKRRRDSQMHDVDIGHALDREGDDQGWGQRKRAADTEQARHEAGEHARGEVDDDDLCHAEGFRKANAVVRRYKSRPSGGTDASPPDKRGN